MQLLQPAFRWQGAQASSTGWIGIEIGTTAIKIAQLERKDHQSRIARSIVVNADDERPFDVGCFESGRIGQEIRKALTSHGGFRGRNTACVLSMHFCGLRTLSSAAESDEERRELIGLELSPKVSSSRQKEAIEFDFWDCPNQPADENGMTPVHVLSIPSSLSYSVGRNLLAAGLNCQVLDGLPLTMMRSASLMDDTGAPDDQPVAILDWDHSAATLIVSQHNQPLLTRSIKGCGLQRLMTAIRQRLKISSVDAETLLKTYGIDGGEEANNSKRKLQIILSDLASDLLTELEEEISQTLEFFEMQFRGLCPSKLTLVGAGSCISNLSERLTQNVGIPSSAWQLNEHGPESGHPASLLASTASLSALGWEL
ncbi:pilus assembly protein PilM [Aporhodopirellula aestuarii]|uniref:Pilus assembly protein PilM n=1 Tax=Aporhodopirellula aestuarii TaxID=2950107 RepID=A0ABT0U9I2_9BACT|nr:pilus assembly protein PilM [Aporhodopirellula aestuarii]MCM2373597.1 pilus assembly protein PilM [Aporhodopirellula aestuarii]